MIIEGWLLKNVSPGSFSRRYCKLTGAGTLEWSKTQAYSAKRSTLSLASDGVSLSPTLAQTKEGYWCFAICANEEEAADDDDFEGSISGGNSGAPVWVFGSADRTEAMRWQVAVRGALHQGLARRWRVGMQATAQAHSQQLQQPPRAGELEGERQLAWLASVPPRDWDAEWAACGLALNKLNAAAQADAETVEAAAASNRGGATCGRLGKGVEDEDPLDFDDFDVTACDTAVAQWAQDAADDEEAGFSSSESVGAWGGPLTAFGGEAQALRHRSILLDQFHSFATTVAHAVASAISAAAAQPSSPSGRQSRAASTANAALNALCGKTACPSWLAAGGAGSLLSSVAADPAAVAAAKEASGGLRVWTCGGCVFEAIPLAEAAPARALGHACRALQLLGQHAEHGATAPGGMGGGMVGHGSGGGGGLRAPLCTCFDMLGCRVAVRALPLFSLASSSASNTHRDQDDQSPALMFQGDSQAESSRAALDFVPQSPTSSSSDSSRANKPFGELAAASIRRAFRLDAAPPCIFLCPEPPPPQLASLLPPAATEAPAAFADRFSNSITLAQLPVLVVHCPLLLPPNLDSLLAASPEPVYTNAAAAAAAPDSDTGGSRASGGFSGASAPPTTTATSSSATPSRPVVWASTSEPLILGLLLPSDASLPPAPIGLPVDLNAADEKATAKGGIASSSSAPKPRASSRKDRHRYSSHHTPVAEVAPMAEAVVWSGDGEPPPTVVDAQTDSDTAARGNRPKPPRPRPSRRNDNPTSSSSSSSSSSSTSTAPNDSSGRDAASAAAEALARAGLARRSARQQRLVELLCAVGAVLRVPASQVQCRMSPTTGAVVWVASPAAAAHAAAQAEASLMQMAKSRHTASGAVAHQAREKRAASLAAPNQRASALCGEAVLGDAVVTLPGAVDGLAGLALGSNNGKGDSSSVLGAALHLAPVRFRREFLMTRATPTPPFEPQHCRRIRETANSLEAAASGRNSSHGGGGGARGSSRGRPPVLKRPPPRLPSHRNTAGGAATAASTGDATASGTAAASQVDPLLVAADVTPVSGAAQALAEAAYALRREIAVNLGQRLRGCGDLTQHRSPYEEEAESSDDDEDDNEDEKIRRLKRHGTSNDTLQSGAAGAAASKGLPTSLVAVFHGGHAVSLAHAAGVNVCLLPAVLSGVPATEASVHHLLRAELVARAAKHSFRARLAHLLERLDDDTSWPQPDGKGAPEDLNASTSGDDQNDNDASSAAIDDEDAAVGPFAESRGATSKKSKRRSSINQSSRSGAHSSSSSESTGPGHRTATAEASVLALLLNTVLFDPACPIDVLEQDARKARRAAPSRSSTKSRRDAEHTPSNEDDEEEEDGDHISSYGGRSQNNSHRRSSSSELTAQVAAATQLIGDVRATGRLLIGGSDGPKGQVVRGARDPTMGGARVGSLLWRRRSACTRSAQRLTRAHARWWGVESLVHLSLGGFGSVGRLPITAAEAGLPHHVADGLSPLQLAAPLLRQTRAVLPVGILRRLQATGRLPMLAPSDVAVLGSAASADPTLCASSPLACVPSHALTARAAALGPTHPGSSSHGLGATLRALARARLSLPGYVKSSSGSSELGAAYADLCAEVFGPDPHQQQPGSASGKSSTVASAGGASVKTQAGSSSSRSRGSSSSTSTSKVSDSPDKVDNDNSNDNQLLCSPLAVALSADAHLGAALEAARSHDFAAARARHAAAVKLLLSSSANSTTRAGMTAAQPPQRPLETLLAASILEATLPRTAAKGGSTSTSDDWSLNRAGLLNVWRVLQVATPATADGHCLALWTGHPLAVAIAAALAAADHAADVKANRVTNEGGGIGASGASSSAGAAAAAELGYAVGERVEVRDEDEDEWSEGVVLALEGFDPQCPRVLKDGYDSAYLWDFTRKLRAAKSSGTKAYASSSQKLSPDGAEDDGGVVLSASGPLGRPWLAALQSTTTPPYHWSLTTGRANDATLCSGGGSGSNVGNPNGGSDSAASAEAAAADALDSLWALTRALLVQGAERCGASGPDGTSHGVTATLVRQNGRRGSSASAGSSSTSEATGVVAPVGGLGMACAAHWLLAKPEEETAVTSTTATTTKVPGSLKSASIMGEGADVGRADGRLYLGGNLFGLSADDKGKISARTNQQQGSSDEEGDDDDDNATAADKKETRSTAAELLDAPPSISGLLLAGDWVVRQVSCGYRHTALITTTGLLLTCGHGETGRLGHGDERSRHFPTVVRAFLGNQGADNNNSSNSSSGGSNRVLGSNPSAPQSPRAEGVVFVACGREHTVAVDEDGGVWSWGWGEAGRLGIGEVGKVLTPTLITEYLGARPEKSTQRAGGAATARASPPTQVKSIGVACGREHTLIWTTNGQVYACGPGYGGRLGLGTSNKDVLYPTLVGSGVDLEHELVVSAACGDMHSAVATASGCVYTWGFGATGALGHSAKSLSNQPLPKRVDAFLTAFDDFVAVSSVACGAYHTLALSTRGEVFAFGDGESGALGLSDRGDAATHRAATPTLVPALHDLAFGDNDDNSDEDDDNDGHHRGRSGVNQDDNNEEEEGDDDDDDEDVFKYGDQWSEEDSNEGAAHGHDAPVNPREGLRLQGSGAQDGSGWGAIAAIAAGHLTSAAVDRKGRLYVWGCPYAEDGVQPTDAELVPRRCRVSSAPSTTASSSSSTLSSSSPPPSSSQGAVAFRSVGMGGYHTVVATQVKNRWGQPFDANFSGLPRGLQLPTAKHAERNKASDDLDHELALLAASQAEQAKSDSSKGGSALADAAKTASVDPRVGRLLVAPGCGAGPSTEGPSGLMFDHPGRTHQALFVSPAIDNGNVRCSSPYW